MEKHLVNKILKFCKTRPRCKAEKRHGSIYTELGAPDVNIDEIQDKRLSEWEEAGSKTYVIWTFEEFLSIMPER
jgi:hypothetical protein